uniref:DNA2/NAM7 helicase-like C-terminal domain-containing protein n=1 Tax=Salix viminalis TaxID=40686 RepID=A0A6N2NBF0_SALVM
MRLGFLALIYSMTLRTVRSFAVKNSGASSLIMNVRLKLHIRFVTDVRWMNIALTRAKLSFWILGNARTLQTNRNWATLVKDAKERNLVISAKPPYESLFETAPRDACKRESINNHSRLSRHAENSRSSGKLGKQNEQKVHRDKKTLFVLIVARDGKDFYIQSSKRKAREEHDLTGKMDVKSVIPGESVTGDESKGRERSEKKLDSGEQRNLLKARRSSESFTSSDEGSLKSKEVNDGKDPNPVDGHYFISHLQTIIRQLRCESSAQS